MLNLIKLYLTCVLKCVNLTLHQTIITIVKIIYYFNTVCFIAIIGAVKLNPNTNQVNNKDIETELSKWFSNARDRGTDGRRYTITKNTMTAPNSD